MRACVRACVRAFCAYLPVSVVCADYVSITLYQFQFYTNDTHLFQMTFKNTNSKYTQCPKITSILEQLYLISAYYGPLWYTNMINPTYYMLLIICKEWFKLKSKKKSNWKVIKNTNYIYWYKCMYVRLNPKSRKALMLCSSNVLRRRLQFRRWYTTADASLASDMWTKSLSYGLFLSRGSKDGVCQLDLIWHHSA